MFVSDDRFLDLIKRQGGDPEEAQKSFAEFGRKVSEMAGDAKAELPDAAAPYLFE